eukprot:2642615-Prymnesium_polylepis.1
MPSSRLLTGRVAQAAARRLRGHDRALPVLPSRSRTFSSAAASSSAPTAPAPTAPAPTFEALGLSESLCAALADVGLERPSSTQSLAIPPLLQRRSIALAASTGSGKTLAYLLPTFDGLRCEELERPRVLTDARCSPRALVLAPTRDL